MEKCSRNFRFEFLETGSGSGGRTGGVNPLQVLPECSVSTKKQPRDGSGSPFCAGASGALHSTRIFPAPPPEIFGSSTRLFLVLHPFFI
jgi:hypothetical protein